MAEVGQWGHPEQYILTPQQLDIIRHRAERRNQLKIEYYRMLYNPYKNMRVEGGYPFDPAIQRFTSTRADYYHYFKPTLKNFAFGLGSFFIPTALLTWICIRMYVNYDARCRNAEIPWRYRLRKWI